MIHLVYFLLHLVYLLLNLVHLMVSAWFTFHRIGFLADLVVSVDSLVDCVQSLFSSVSHAREKASSSEA